MTTHCSSLAWKIPWTEDPGSPWGFKEWDMTEQLTLSLSREHAWDELLLFQVCKWFHLNTVIQWFTKWETGIQTIILGCGKVENSGEWAINWTNELYICVCVLFTKSYLTLCDPMNCSPPGSSVHGISKARILEWVAIRFSRGSFWPRYWTQVSCIAGRFFTNWATREAQSVLLLFSHSVVSDSCDPMDCSTPGFPVLLCLLGIAQTQPIESMLPYNHFILCCPLLLLPSVFPSIRVFSNELALHIRWLNYWSFCFSISLSNEASGLISFRIDWFDVLAIKGLSRALQHHSSKASVLQCSAFFMVQLSHLYITIGKTIALTTYRLFSTVMSLVFNTLSRLVITFLPRSKCLLISWLQSPSAVIWEHKLKINKSRPIYRKL